MAEALDRVCLPIGTVTFLVTDIEASTNLARALGNRWPDVLDEHHDILRTAIRSHGGIDFGIEKILRTAAGVSDTDARVPSAVMGQYVEEARGGAWR